MSKYSERHPINAADALANKVRSSVYFNNQVDAKEVVRKYFGLERERHDEEHPWKEKWDWE